jgi:DNA-binding response OmpR family regulator
MSARNDLPTQPSILVVEHDPAAGEPLVEQLVADGCTARLARTAAHARSLARGSCPDLLVLGALQPAHAALDLLVEVRTGASAAEGERSAGPWRASMPVIVLAAHAHEADVLRAFEAGADDFLAGPLSYLELRARLRAVLARARDDPARATVRVGSLTIDTVTRSVTLHGSRLALRRLEYELLLALAREPERVLTRNELMRRVWGEHSTGSTRTLDSHASRLRRTLGAVRAERWIVNVLGVGYRLS